MQKHQFLSRHLLPCLWIKNVNFLSLISIFFGNLILFGLSLFASTSGISLLLLLKKPFFSSLHFFSLKNVIELLNVVHTDKLKLLFLWRFLGLEWIRYFAKRIIHIVILIILSHKSIIPHLILLIHKVKKQLITSRDVSSLRKKHF